MSSMNEETRAARADAKAVFAKVQAMYWQWINRGSAAILREDELFLGFKELADKAAAHRSIDSAFAKLGYRFANAWERIERYIRMADEDGYIPTGAIWQAWDDLENFWLDDSRIVLPDIESLDQLLALKGMTNLQIAAIYEWEKDDGSPDLDRVNREIAKKPEDRVKPTNPKQIKHDNAWKELAAKIDHVRLLRDNRSGSATKEGPEEWAAMLRTPEDGGQGISARQIAGIKRCTIAQVYAKADEMGIPRPPLDYGVATVPRPMPERVTSNADEYEADLDAAAEITGSAINTEDPNEAAAIAEVLDFSAQGYDPSTVAQMTGRKVKEVRKILADAAAAAAK